MWNPFRPAGPVKIPSPKPLSEAQPEILLTQVHGRDALKAWEQLRAEYSQTGLWPIVVGDDKELSHLTDLWDDPFPNPTPFPKSDPEEWFTWAPKAKREWVAKKLAENGAPPLAEEESDPARFHGEWPENVRPDETYVVPADIVTKKAKPRVNLALVPVQHPSEVPLKLAFGGWNENPYPEEHAVVFRYFHEKYGAEPVCISGDVIEMKVLRPPQTKAEALALAEKQFIYCEDIVTQGTETIELLAASLLKGKKWFFWWD
jgi:Domain of unknown function (DUF4253)